MSAATVTPDRTRGPEPIIDLGQTLAESCFVLRVKYGRFGNSKKIRPSQITVDADAEWVSANKKLLKSDELDAIRQADTALTKRLDCYCAPGLDTGVRFVKHAAVETVRRLLVEHRDITRPALIDAFLNQFDNLQREAERRLHAPGHAVGCQCSHTLYNPDEYATLEEVRDQFTFTWRFDNLGTPESLRRVNVDVFVEEREKLRRDLRDVAEEIKASRRAVALELVTHLRDRLTDDKDGKRKTLHKTAVTHLTDFLEGYDLAEVTTDAELRTHIEQLRGMTQGLDVERLKESDSFRAAVRANMDAIATELDKLVIDRPGRAMSLEE